MYHITTPLSFFAHYFINKTTSVSLSSISRPLNRIIIICAVSLSAACVPSSDPAPSSKAGKTYFVAKTGSNKNDGSEALPFLTISHAAKLAQPGDTVVVRAGVYREAIDPPRGGTSDTNRITYKAAENEHVVITGSERVKGWKKVNESVWRLTLPNSFFGGYNPYQTKIAGDWFIDNGRNHHTGAVYVDGHWLWEAPNLETVLGQRFDIDKALANAQTNANDHLFDLRSFSVGESKLFLPHDAHETGNTETDKTTKTEFLKGTQSKPTDLSAVAIKKGDWFKFNNVDFTTDNGFVRLYASADMLSSSGANIAVKLDSLTNDPIANIEVRPTDSWQDFRIFKSYLDTKQFTKGSAKHDVYLQFGPPTNDQLRNRFEQVERENNKLQGQALWYAEVTDRDTTIYTQFGQLNPNIDGIEINVRETVFYPSQPGINFITVSGFEIKNAATNWTPPTAEQVAAIGSHWSKGWIIENNSISYARCACLSLGKYGDKYDNTSANSASGYVGTIERALNNGWNKHNIGQHIVRNNRISHCEQAGIVGSMGAAFSSIIGNTINDIHRQELFDGYEMAGIKFHGPIDTIIADNTIFSTKRGIWLDWMSQGTRVSSNILYDNKEQDLWMEVNHGPAIIDNNLFLSDTAIYDWSQGTAFVHNLIAGAINPRPIPERATPYFEANNTTITGIKGIDGGDNRYVNNIFVNHDLSPYQVFQSTVADDMKRAHDRYRTNERRGNVFVNTELIFDKNKGKLLLTDEQKPLLLQYSGDRVDSKTFGKTAVSQQPYTAADGTEFLLTLRLPL